MPIDRACELLRRHPEWASLCPEEVWLQFGRVHWAKLICERPYEPGKPRIFVEKMKALGRDSLVTGWCCLNHWANAYQSFYVTCAAAAPREMQLARIAENSAMNPEKHDWPGRQWGEDMVQHCQWLATVAADFAEAAALAADPERSSQRDAETYARIAEAANWEIQALRGEVPELTGK